LVLEVGTMTRILVAARLSRLVKGRDQLSIERQDETAQHYAEEAGDLQPILVADPGVSGSVSPFKRPNLAPYLTDTPPEDWTELVASAIDRLGRNARDLFELRNWCEDRGKRITVLSPRLHWPPAEDDMSSRITWTVLEQLAEIELRQTRYRYAQTRDLLRSHKSMIGKACWGFRVTGPKLGKTITPDPAKVPYLLRMVEMAQSGTSQNDIARWLDAEHVKPRHSATWSARSVGQILRNESLYGVYREAGKILLRHQGVITKDRWDALQSKLDSNPKRRGPTRSQPMMLTDVLYCAKCHRVMHARRSPGKPRKDGTPYVWVGYRCDGTPREPSTCTNWIPAADIEHWVDQWFTIPADAGGSGFADVEIVETVPVPAKGHTEEIQEIDNQIDDLSKDDPGFLAEVTRLMTERTRLVELGTEPAHTEDHPTGILIGHHWPTLDAAGKRDYLRRSGVKVYAASKKTERAEREAGLVAGGMECWITGDPRRVIGTLARPVTV
jgi:DNA invertase Pin-like site-specific DNA recombinase